MARGTWRWESEALGSALGSKSHMSSRTSIQFCEKSMLNVNQALNTTHGTQ